LKKSFFDTKKVRKDRVILAAIKLPHQRAETIRESLDELATLCRSAGGEVVSEITQAREAMRPGYIFGEGKLRELRELCGTMNVQLIIYDGELTASQQEKLEAFCDTAVIDRPALILDIFARHARSREAKTQVELAQLEYLLPRLAGHWTHLERQEAAIGTRGPGETQLETDRRLVNRKIIDLKKTLKKIDRDRDTQRKRRNKMVNVCLVGYTNTGKSSLFNRLTGDRALVADRLFATLDSTTRTVRLEGKSSMLLTDTVGFIRKLPVDLIASFKSTLKEASSADLLLHVVDFSDHDIENKIGTVNEVLTDIGAGDIQRLLVFNKVDLINNPELRTGMIRKYSGSRFVSAKTGEGIEQLKDMLLEFCSQLYVDIQAAIAEKNTETIALASKLIHIYNSYIENGDLIFQGRILKTDMPKLEKEGALVAIIKPTSQ
jgi:GTP-binding protein HflX